MCLDYTNYSHLVLVFNTVVQLAWPNGITNNLLCTIAQLGLKILLAGL